MTTLKDYGDSNAYGILAHDLSLYIVGNNSSLLETLWISSNNTINQIDYGDPLVPGSAQAIAFRNGVPYIVGQKNNNAILCFGEDLNNFTTIQLDTNGIANSVYIPPPTPVTTSLKFQSPYKYQR